MNLRQMLQTVGSRMPTSYDAIVIGIHGHRDPRAVARLNGMLLMPFKGKVDGYAINRREWSGAGSGERAS